MLHNTQKLHQAVTDRLRQQASAVAAFLKISDVIVKKHMNRMCCDEKTVDTAEKT